MIETEDGIIQQSHCKYTNDNGRDKILSRRVKPAKTTARIVCTGKLQQAELSERSSNKASKHAHFLVKHLNNKQTDPKIT